MVQRKAEQAQSAFLDFSTFDVECPRPCLLVRPYSHMPICPPAHSLLDNHLYDITTL